jgi:hypothetical protein
VRQSKKKNSEMTTRGGELWHRSGERTKREVHIILQFKTNVEYKVTKCMEAFMGSHQFCSHSEVPSSIPCFMISVMIQISAVYSTSSIFSKIHCTQWWLLFWLSHQ